MSSSLSRSLVQESSGCRSQLTSVTSAFLLLGVLLLAGPLFQPLPICVLAAIIVSSLTGMFKKFSWTLILDLLSALFLASCSRFSEGPLHELPLKEGRLFYRYVDRSTT